MEYLQLQYATVYCNKHNEMLKRKIVCIYNVDDEPEYRLPTPITDSDDVD